MNEKTFSKSQSRHPIRDLLVATVGFTIFAIFMIRNEKIVGQIRNALDVLNHGLPATIIAIYLAGVIVATPIKVLRAILSWFKFNSLFSRNLSLIGQFPNWVSGGFDRPGIVMPGGQRTDFFVSTLALFLSWIYIMYLFVIAPFVIKAWISDRFAPQSIKDARWRLKNRRLSKEQVIDEVSAILCLDADGRRLFTAEVEQALSDRS